MRRTASYPWIAGCALLAACFAANKPLDSTQTGNPPVIHSDRVALKIKNDEVHLIGEAGAVKPGNVSIEVTNLQSGEVVVAKVAADGSFDVRVDASPDAAFSVRAKASGEVSMAVYVTRGGAAVGDGRDGGLSCQQRTTLSGDMLRWAAEAADRTCSSDSDCRVVLPTTKCYAHCDYASVSEAGSAQIERAEREIDAGLCVDYAKDACTHTAPSCEPPPPPLCLMGRCGTSGGSMPDLGPPSCNQLQLQAGARYDEAEDAASQSCMTDADCEIIPVNVSCFPSRCQFGQRLARGERAAFEAAVAKIESEQCGAFSAMGCNVTQMSICTPIDLEDVACVNNVCAPKPPPAGDLPDCVTCFQRTLEWGYSGGRVANETRSKLEPCVHYTRTRTSTRDGSIQASCSDELRACNAEASTGGVETALAHADVQAALNQGEVMYGTDKRPVDAPIFRILAGMQLIYVGNPCTADLTDCKPVPPGVQALVDLLQRIDSYMTMQGCAMFPE